MSADRWGQCPVCCEKLRRAYAKREQEVEAQYGKVSSREYKALQAELAKLPNPNPAPGINYDVPDVEYMLREDWELCTNIHGRTYIVYGCSCQRCGFSYDHKHEVVHDISKIVDEQGE